MSACGGDGSNNGRAKRKRGRTAGSKNKPKFPPVASSAPDAATLNPHVLEIPAGGDVAETIAAFARRCRIFGVCVLSASGPIAAAVLWDASSSTLYPSTLTFQGRFDLLSITATFLPGGREGSLAVTMAGPNGQVLGGVVAGPVVPAGTVIVVPATFASPAFHCFDHAITNTPTSSMSPVFGKSLPAEKFEKEKSVVDGDTASLLGGGGEAENQERDILEKYMEELEQCLDVIPTEEKTGGEGGGEEMADGTVLEQYVRELERCLELPADIGCASSGGDVASLFGGDGEDGDGGDHWEGNIFEQYLHNVFGGGCGEHFASDAFRVSGVCPPPLF